MKPTSIATAQYAPAPVPADPAQLPRYLEQELFGIAAAISLLAAGHIGKSYAAPAKARDGDIRYADGTSWNPGSGKGIYMSNGSVWTLIKAIP